MYIHHSSWKALDSSGVNCIIDFRISFGLLVMVARWCSGCVLDCQGRVPKFEPRPGQKFRSVYLFHALRYSASGRNSGAHGQ